MPTQFICGTGLGGIICQINYLINSIIPLLIGLGVIYFIWGVVMYVIADSDEAKKKGKDHMIWGIIGFAVIFSIWGIVGVVVRTFNLGGQAIYVPSLVPTPSVVGAGCTIGSNVQGVMNFVTCLIRDSVIPLMFALAVAFFIWGMIQFLILGAGDETKRSAGRQHMIWGIIALTAMVSVWTLVGIVGGTFGLNTSVLPSVRPNYATPPPGP